MSHDTHTLSNQQWQDNFRHYLQRRFPDRSTSVHYSSDLKLFCHYIAKPLPSVGRADVEQFLDAQASQGLAASTLKRRLASLKTFFDFLLRQQDRPLHDNPVSMKYQSPRQPKLLPRDLKNHEVEQLLAHVYEPRALALFSLMLYGGLRVSELTRLTPYHFEESTTADSTVKLRVLGKGMKERCVYLLWEAYLSVQCYLEQEPVGLHQRLFRNKRGEPISPSGIQDIVRRYAESSGVPFTAHRLRHTCARWLAEGRMPLFSLSRFLGHSALQTTQRYIDGADPQVREDYDQAFARLAESQQSPSKPLETFKNPALLTGRQPLQPEPEQETEFVPPPLFEKLPKWVQQDCLDWLHESWFRWKPSRRQRNALRDLGCLAQVIKWGDEVASVESWEELTESRLQEYIGSSLERGLSVVTVKSYLNRLFRFLRFLKKKNRLTRVPEYPRLVTPDALPRHLQPVELLRLEQAAEEEGRKEDGDKLAVALYYVLAHGGLRLCEVMDLNTWELELENRKVRLNEGKGRRDRVVYVTEKASDYLQEYVREHVEGEGRVFRVKGQRITGGQVWERIKRLGQTAEIDNLYPQRLRHTYATTLLNNGMRLELLRKLMGHETMNMTLMYARLADQTLEEQYRKAMQVIDIKEISPNNR